jgi:hypothetical protein
MKAQTNIGMEPGKLSTRFLYAGVGLVLGLILGSLIWMYDSLTHQHPHVFIILILIMAGTAIGFFATDRAAAWLDTILYFMLLGFMNR